MLLMFTIQNPTEPSHSTGYYRKRVLTHPIRKSYMGAWTGQLIPSWAPHLRATRQLQGWLPVDEEHASLFGAEHMPTWVMVHPAYPLPLYYVRGGPPAVAQSRHSRPG
jgi:hypothetical protein